MSNFEDQLWSQLLRERGEQMRAAPEPRPHSRHL